MISQSGNKNVQIIGYGPDKADKTALDTVKQQVETIPLQSGIFGKLKGMQQKILFPNGWKWTDAPINIYKDRNGIVSTDFDVSKFKPKITGKTYYVKLTGSDSNDGLTPATALRKVYTAFQKADCSRIIVGGGVYDRASGFFGYYIERDIIIEAAEGEKPIFSSHDDLVWTKTTGTINVYQATRSAVNDVYDAKFVNKLGEYQELVLKTSIAEVDATPGSYYIEGSVVYVHTVNSRVADSGIRAMMNTNNARFIGGGKYYIEGIVFEGGNSALRVENTASSLYPEIYGKNCQFKYTKLLNAVTILGAKHAFFQNCKATRAMQDGFNYHQQNGVKVKAIEVNCIGNFNGRDGANQNNGSTNHDGGYTIRVNGEYHHNSGPNVIDVNEGAQSWIIGVSAHESRASTGISNSDFKNGNDGASEMWLDSCASFGSDYSFVTAGVGSKSYEHNNLFESALTAVDNNVIQEYNPTLIVASDDYSYIGETFLKRQANYDSVVGAGWVYSSTTYHYTTVVGNTMLFSFTGTGLDFFSQLTDRGGVWEFKIDNEPPVTVSTHLNAVSDKTFLTGNLYKKTIARSLTRGVHNVVATFKGDDVNNPPATAPSRGNVYVGAGSSGYFTFDVYDY